jgi:CheY-like chemotaxis protein/anti-sigma regulatory factor (Ser/Thr protein kinase)
MLALRAHEKGLELVCHLPADVPDALIGDPGRLRQVMLNLIGNALKFTEKGEIVLEAALEGKSEAEAYLHFTIQDTGIGIPAEKQQAIFEPFAQADGSTTRKYGGTGLGLTISSQLVDMMGGRIWVESEPGRGSTFHFTVRLRIQSTPVVRPLAPPTGLRAMPVLVVDDNATNRRILKDLLRNWRMNPTEVESAAAALTALQEAVRVQRPFGLILLDGHMPEMDGFGLAQRIEECPDFAQPTIMMLTSGDQNRDAARCRDLGVVAYLVKPIQQADLVRAIITALHLSSNGQRRPGPESTRPASKKGLALKILLAEDNCVNQRIAVHLLEKQGHQVRVAGNGKEALAALEQEPFDVVLMDVQMPEMDGFEATAAIRAKETATGGHLPIIALTAHAMNGDRERCLAAGMDGYASKPIQIDDLLRAIRSALPPPAEPYLAVARKMTDVTALDLGVALTQFAGRAALWGRNPVVPGRVPPTHAGHPGRRLLGGRAGSRTRRPHFQGGREPSVRPRHGRRDIQVGRDRP